MESERNPRAGKDEPGSEPHTRLNRDTSLHTESQHPGDTYRDRVRSSVSQLLQGKDGENVQFFL